MMMLFPAVKPRCTTSQWTVLRHILLRFSIFSSGNCDVIYDSHKMHVSIRVAFLRNLGSPNTAWSFPSFRQTGEKCCVRNLSSLFPYHNLICISSVATRLFSLFLLCSACRAICVFVYNFDQGHVSSYFSYHGQWRWTASRKALKNQLTPWW